MMKRLVFSAIMAVLCGGARGAADRPNILWIVSEDNSPYLGCYGDRNAQTPNLDRLAAQGVRFRNAISNAPVCSTTRTTLIAGMHATTLGAHNHRSDVRIPDQFKTYPEHFRAAGYYATNNAKTDYNISNVGKPWDDSSARAHYKNRPPGKPFFAVFNLGSSHESQVAPKAGKRTFRIAPEKIDLPPYHPDTADMRRDWANYYDQMTVMDGQAGVLLDELTELGLAEDTIVFYYGDHGGALPGGKRNIHDRGTRVPMIVRVPAKWAHLAPAKPGEWFDGLITFVDLAPTAFALCGIPVPENYQGRAIFGAPGSIPYEHVFLYRGRMDERYDVVRAVRDRETRYVKNFAPHQPWGQHYTYPFEVQPSMRSWYAEFAAGRTNEAQSAYWKPKPAEEFYVLGDDRFEQVNLVGDRKHAAKVGEMRARLRQEMIATRDTGLIPEGMFSRLAGKKTLYDYAQSAAYPIERVLDIAEKATSRDETHMRELIAALDDRHPVIRYWGAIGCLVLQEKAAAAKPKLQACLKDEWPDVRIAAAEALGFHGDGEAGFAVLVAEMKSSEPYIALTALNAAEYMWRSKHVSLPHLQAAVKELKLGEPAGRIPKYLLSLR